MKTKKHLLIIALLLMLGTIKSFATSWDEPWMDKVIKEAQWFVLADIKSFDEEKGVKIKIVKQFGGEKLPEEIEITDFYLLHLTSSSGGHGPEFHFKGVEKGYFFIKKNAEGKYCIATPTTGFNSSKKGNVYAAYRHSYHQAMVPVDIYEMTMTAIFNHYHQLPYEKTGITDFIDKQLAQKPASFDETEINTFFLQHVALESIYHLRLEGYYEKILPFFNDDKNFHNRISGARALVNYNTEETKKLLLNKVAKSKDDDFVAVICIWTLKELKPKELKPDLEKLVKRASEAENGFGGNIMDPRIGTRFPTVKSALQELIKTL